MRTNRAKKLKKLKKKFNKFSDYQEDFSIEECYLIKYNILENGVWYDEQISLIFYSDINKLKQNHLEVKTIFSEKLKFDNKDFKIIEVVLCD